jgi:RND family efflux transporter MFP subunit
MIVFAGLAVGVALAVMFVVNRQTPTHGGQTPSPPALAVLEVQPLPFRIDARGYGTARSAETWRAIANVPGRVRERHPDLESGKMLRKGTLLLSLDPSRYELAIAEAEAELAGLAAEENQLETEGNNIRGLLALEQDRLDLAEKELSRIEALAESGSVSRSRRDEQFSATLSQRQAVSTLENQLSLIPSRRQRLKAQKERAATRLEQAGRDLEDTRFVAPYDLRLTEVDVEMHQYVGAGQRVFLAENIEGAEVEVHFPISMVRRVMAGVMSSAPRNHVTDPAGWMDFSAVSATVYLVGVKGVQWPARVTRVAGGLDPQTRTVKVVVVVDDPYRLARPPDRPPLHLNMYVRVHLSTESPDPLVVIPASAVHHGEVYLADDDDRLEIREVKVAFEQNDLAVISEGLSSGDRVIVDDPVPAIQGMRVLPRPDKVLEERIRMSAKGGDR